MTTSDYADRVNLLCVQQQHARLPPSTAGRCPGLLAGVGKASGANASAKRSLLASHLKRWGLATPVLASSHQQPPTRWWSTVSWLCTSKRLRGCTVRRVQKPCCTICLATDAAASSGGAAAALSAHDLSQSQEAWPHSPAQAPSARAEGGATLL